MIEAVQRALTTAWWAIYDTVSVAWRILFAAAYRRKWPY